MKRITSLLPSRRTLMARRDVLLLASGALIVAALLADPLAGMRALRGILMVAAALLAGSDIAARAWASLRHRHISIELLVTIAATGALLIGEYWEAAAVTFLFLLGAYLEARTMSRTRGALQELFDLAPVTAIVLRDGQQVEVAPAEVRRGETVLVKPGSNVPVDGEVCGGHSTVDESAITGEPLAVEKTEGSRVFAGTINQGGALRVRATGVGADTTLARIIRRVEEAQEAKAPAQRFIEGFARWYTPAILALSGVVLLLSRDLALALTLLVIGCPGALVISTPVSVVAGIGRAARRGILIKGGEYLENTGRISALALDKTGTLTEGKPRLTDVVVLRPGAARRGTPGDGDEGEGWTQAQQEVLRWAGIAEASSEHPLARPILEEARRLSDIPTPASFESLPGRGIRATHEGREVLVGTPVLMEERGIAVSDEARRRLDALREDAKSVALVALDGVILGLLGIADSLRDTAAPMVRELHEAGVERVVMLTGDSRRTAERIAAAAGVGEVHAGLLPEEKLENIRQLQAGGHVVAMVGDGINDAPALAAADIGIAMGAAGTGIALESADIALMADDLMKLPEAIALSRATLRNIRQNVAVALVTVVGLLVGVLLGEVHMAGGMFIHELSVLLVVLNGMRLMTVQPPRSEQTNARAVERGSPRHGERPSAVMAQ